MKKDFGVKHLLIPQPVLIIGTYDENGNPNAMNATLGGMVETDEIMIFLSNHKTTENLEKNRACTIAIGDTKNVVACDYVGIVSDDNTPDKIEKAGWTTTKSKYVNAPMINELPVTLECILLKIVDSYKYLFKIRNVSVDESILTNGKIDFEKFHPITYYPAGYGYYELGERIGEAYSEGNKIKLDLNINHNKSE